MSHHPSPWRPLFEGSEARRFQQAVAAIADELVRRGPQLLETTGRPRSASLAGGAAGLALFFAYLARATASDEHAERAVELLDQAAEILATETTLPDLYAGFTGIAWVNEHLDGMLFESDGEDANAAIDEALLTLLAEDPWRRDYDLIRGLAGFAVYALERLPRPSAVRCLESIVERLSGIAVPQGEGLTWHTPPYLLPDHQRERHPRGYYNAGVAHGMPAVLPILARTAAAGVAVARARRLLEGGVAWLLGRELPAGSGCAFPYAFAADGGYEPSRLAWCYGDPGVAAALLDAARAAGEPAWEGHALRIALATIERAPEDAGVKDAGLCHGTAGLGHLYNRLFQATGDPRFAEAARSWLRRSFDYRHPELGVAGFASYGTFGGETVEWHDDAGFLTGATGVGLAMLAAITDVAPDWDRVLAVSVPPRGIGTPSARGGTSARDA